MMDEADWKLFLTKHGFISTLEFQRRVGFPVTGGVTPALVVRAVKFEAGVANWNAYARVDDKRCTKSTTGPSRLPSGGKTAGRCEKEAGHGGPCGWVLKVGRFQKVSE